MATTSPAIISTTLNVNGSASQSSTVETNNKKMPWLVSDGSYGAALVISEEPSFPFFERGDASSFEWNLRVHIDKGIYRQMSLMSAYATFLGTCYLVDTGKPKDIGMNEYELDLTYASIPARREEGASINYTIQSWKTNDGEWEIVENTFTFAGINVFEYFTYRPNPLYRYRVYIDINGTLNSIGDYPPPPGNFRIAEDSDIQIYKGGIYVRVTPYIYLPVPSQKGP